jgi:hypothetical protein
MMIHRSGEPLHAQTQATTDALELLRSSERADAILLERQ